MYNNTQIYCLIFLIWEVVMAGQIRITPSDMRDRASEYRVQRANVEDVISKMDSLLRRLNEEWEGEASRAYAEKFEELKPNFIKAKDLIEEIACSLDQTAETLERTDQDIARAFGSR